MKKKILTGLALLGCTIMLFGNESMAASKAKQITIKSAASTIKVGQTLNLDSRIRPSSARIKDRNIVWTSSNSKVVKVLDKYDDDTKIKGIKEGTATITVKIKNTTLKASRKVSVKKTQKNTSAAAYEKKISTYNNDGKAIYKEISNTSLAALSADRINQYHNLLNKIELLENKISRLEDDIEDKYWDGKITKTQYRTLDRLLDRLEDYLDTVDDFLDRKFNYEFDD